ncbi:hypothetical protein PP1Y_Lpl870 (plasmid) [Novosphingobium sp. PP1Y]|nr:hypothetical protein PP1Y_Lpl870 [Novosphingobium sp. PP1Y]
MPAASYLQLRAGPIDTRRRSALRRCSSTTVISSTYAHEMLRDEALARPFMRYFQMTFSSTLIKLDQDPIHQPRKPIDLAVVKNSDKGARPVPLASRLRQNVPGVAAS